MSYTLKTKLINRENYGSIRNLSDIKYIVIHYTANDGDTDENNANYFTNNVVKVSAHYFVDSDSVTNTVPDNYVAYHCGANTYKHPKCRNANSIGIEICDDVKNGVIYPSEKTIENTIELTKKLMKQYNIPQENVIRHFDVTGKICPAYWSGTTEKNNKWKTEFWNKLVEIPSQSTPNSSTNQKTYKFNIGDKVVVNGNLYKNANAKTPTSTVKNKTTVITRRAENTLHPYNTTGDLGWMNESDIKPATGTTTTTKPVTPKTYKKGDVIKLSNTPLYANATTTKVSSKKTGTYYIYDGVKTNGRYRITNKADRCGKKPIWMYVTGWVKL